MLQKDVKCFCKTVSKVVKSEGVVEGTAISISQYQTNQDIGVAANEEQVS